MKTFKEARLFTVLACSALLLSANAVMSRAQNYLPSAAPSQGMHPEVGIPRVQLVPVPNPNLSGMEDIVRKQVRDAQSALESIRQKSGVTDEQLSQAYGEMGRLFEAYDLLDPALSCFINAHTLAPQEFEWQYYLGYLYQGRGDFRHAVNYFEEALKIRPNDLALLLRLGQAELALNHPNLSKPFFERALAVDESSAVAMAGLGQVVFAEHDFGKAVQYFEAALAIDPDASSIHYPLAMAYRRLGELEKAQLHLGKQGTEIPKIPDGLVDGLDNLRRGTGELWWRGTVATNEGRFADAVDAYREMVAMNPRDPTSRMWLGIALARTRDLQGAIEQFSRALAIAPEHAGAHYNLGIIFVQIGRGKDAVGHFRAAIKSYPSFKDAHFQLANLLMRDGFDEQAEAEYAVVIKAEPQNGFARLMDAMALIRLERYSRARSRLEEAHTALPEDADIANALARLLAASPQTALRNGPRALQIMQQVVKVQKTFDVDQGQTFAMALAETGQFRAAAQLQRSMITELERTGRLDVAKRLRENLTLFEHAQPCRLPWRHDDPVFSPVPKDSQEGSVGVPSVASNR
jgi:tetratricopeptide (TPR) repeat protein